MVEGGEQGVEHSVGVEAQFTQVKDRYHGSQMGQAETEVK